ncbi:alpha-2-macroglobulin family protein [Methylobrevis albus]|uniref:Alpha-2-macroglobulin family protein n=1 Tax=Methylobrevis albus TaxID=2793297 RepID=A0A931N053_9HYPH|nr:alpha-2-macroglobulin family protein [Methylobrevis albus]MBH0239710.1 alpha-2-macroglobulin family protein [Methylobrevis albus]
MGIAATWFGRLLAAVVLCAGLTAAAGAAERRVITTEGADYFGQDLGTLKEVDLSACEAACIADTACRAFTYNTSARWCFLKSSFGDLRAFAGAVSGRIVEGTVATADTEAARLAELGFLAQRNVDEARRLAGEIAGQSVSGSIDAILADAAAITPSDPLAASNRLKEALRLAPERFDIWATFARTIGSASTDDWETRERIRLESRAGAVGAYLRAVTDDERFEGLQLISEAMAAAEVWRPAIKAARAALAIRPDPVLSARLDQLVGEHGFRVTEHTIDTKSASPRICVVFTETLAAPPGDIGDFVTVNGSQSLPVELEGNQVCVDGVAYGERYRVTLRPGIMAADGERLERAADLDIYVRDRDPQLRFVGRAYVLPAGGEATIPVISVNVDTIEARLLRVGDRSLAAEVGRGRFLRQLAQYEAGEIAEQTGEEVWTGFVDVTRDLNRDVTTTLPVGELVTDLEPGVYVLTARVPSKTESWSADATQWFVVTDIGLSTLSGNDGLHAFARSLANAGPVGGAKLRLIAMNDEVLGEATADAEGYARFDAGLMRGSGGSAPALLVAETEAGDYSFLALNKAPFDLTDRGVEGRTPPAPVDVFMTTERGVYRPGETVHVTALARDPTATALGGVALTLVTIRPDGVEHGRELVADAGLGGRDLALSLPEGAMRGSWRVAAYTDPKGPSLAEAMFLVEDFVPERLTFDLAPEGESFDPEAPGAVDLDVRYLYGAPAPGLAVEGTVLFRPAAGLAAFPGVRFGTAGETFDPAISYLSGVSTDETGRATLPLTAPEAPATSLPLEAQLSIRVLDTSGRPVERQAVLPVAASQGRIGLDPAFDGAVDEGGNATIAIVAVGADGAATAAGGLAWTLSKVETQFQWYSADGEWNFEQVKVRTRVADGTVDVAAGERPRVEARVEWGEYELAVRDPSGALLPASMSFEAGWYVAPAAEDTPDAIKVTLDKPRYRIGDTVRARIEPRFAGVALVQVVDDRLIAMQSVEVPLEGTTIEFPVTDAWGPGAYVTASLFRPMDLEAKRMPGRAVGLTYAGVDPGDRRLAVEIELPADPAPRSDLPVAVTLANLPAGEEAYVTVAAVDVGILNLTRFATPDPDGWYFGQRRLGMEIRDLYGQLIDRMIGSRGVVRSGGDGSGLSRFSGTPPTEQLVAFFQGVTRVGADGKVELSVPIPDFNGSVRIMVQAWSKTGVGHGEREVLVRDPVVVNASLPAFLAPGDRSRLLLDVTHLEGSAGAMSIAVTADGGIVEIDAAAGRRSFDLADGGRTQLLVPVTGLEVGDETIDVALTTPDGTVLTKRLTLGVRANEPPVVRSWSLPLETAGTITLDDGVFADFVPGSGAASVLVGGAAGIDLPGLVRTLDRYPYGCAEQITSRALPLVYLDDVIVAAGLTGEAPVRERVQQAITAVLANQSSSGAFGLWAPGSGDTWLDAYVTDFLTRAREKGYAVPDIAFDLAVTNLRNQIAYASDFSWGGQDVAYALYVLARNGRASIGDLRYYGEAKLENFATPLARAQIGAALALYGDNPRAATVFQSAIAALKRGESDRGWRSDYGSDLRDGAAVLTLASETRSDGVDLGDLAASLAAAQAGRRYTSTQEQAWMLLAANALLTGEARPRLAIDGRPVDGVFTRNLSAIELAASPLVIENRGDRRIEARITALGAPAVPEPAGGEGYGIVREYLDLDGNAVDPAAVKLGDRLVAVITVTSTEQVAARLVVSDPLPAGFAIDNPNLISAGDVSALAGLDLQAAVARTEFRADRFVAALDRTGGDPTEFQLAYMVRAIAPGAFAHPAASVEDMYRPEKRARTDSGRVEIVGPVQ